MTKKPLGEDVEFIKALAEILRSHDLAEIEVNREFGEEDSLTVRIARGQAAVAASAAALAPAEPIAPPPAPSPPPVPAAAAPLGEEPGTVTSPMVGTIYLQPEPDSAPFVRVGEAVTEGQTILIIEAMKTMNQIPAPHAGTVRRIIVEDGTPVEFGEPLMVIA